LALVEQSALRGQFSAPLEQVSGDIAENYRPGGPDGLGGGEGDQPVAATHVEHRMSRCHAGVGDDLVAYGCETFEFLTKQFWITAVATFGDPLRPLVALRLRCQNVPFLVLLPTAEDRLPALVPEFR
jgi:hypothetical protein